MPIYAIVDGVTCDAPGSVACVDTRPPGQQERATLGVLPPGQFYIGIDAFSQPVSVPDWESGPYEIEVVATLPGS